jgi:adenylate kinase
MEQQTKIEFIKKWLGAGAINIFGVAFAGKDTVGEQLAVQLAAELISSGELLRQYGETVQESGKLSPTEVFYDVVLPAFSRPELSDRPLILSSIGRWAGEEHRVMDTAAAAGHPIKIALLLEISEAEIAKRMQAARELGDRTVRADDSPEILQTRLDEFNNKTRPVLETYRQLGRLLEINGQQPRAAVFAEVIDKIYDFANYSESAGGPSVG